jgi:hypothetical protein
MTSSPILKRELLEARIKEESKDMVITCYSVRKIAEETGVSYTEAGDAANRLDVKIRKCELGCF